MKTPRIRPYPKAFINLLLGAVIVGILVGRYGEPSMLFYGIAGGLLLVLLVGAGVLLYHGNKYISVVLVLAVFLLGWLRVASCLNIGAGDVQQWAEQDITLIGELQDEPVLRWDEAGELHIKYVVGDLVVVSGGNRHKCQNNIIVYGRANSFDAKKGLLPAGDFGFEQYGRTGDKIKVSGRLMKLHDYQNPGRMDVVMANYARQIHGQMSAGKYSIELTPQDKHYLTRLAGHIRHLYKSRMDAVMPQPDSAAIFAMLFGGYGGLRPELLEAFTITGMIHILSVSGSHITLMAGVADVIGRVLGLSGGRTALLASAIIVLYSLLAGLVIPVIRSAIMGILTIIALSLGRERDAQHILSITALGILLAWPLSLFDISFQLSFGATAGLLYISPQIRPWLGRKLPQFVAGSLSVTLGAQLAVLPFLAWYFNVISISALVANLVVAPIVELIIVVALLAGLVAGLLPLAGRLIYMFTSLLLGLAYELSRLIANLPASRIYVPSMSWTIWLIYYVGLGLWVLPEDNQKVIGDRLRRGLAVLRTRGKYGWLLVVLPVVVVGMWYWFRPSGLQVHFIDVGQGDAALIITPHGRAFMIDAGGTRAGGYDIGGRVDVPYLLHYGVRKLDFIILTHAHDDHAKGVAGILGKIPVGTVLIGHEGLDVYKKTFGGTNSALGQASYGVLEDGGEMLLDGVRIQVLYAPDGGGPATGGTGNEYSNVIRVSYGNYSFLFTGDLTAEQEERLLQQGKELNSTVLKVGHHGSHTSSSEAFLQRVNPRWSVISVGYGNRFGHPHREVLQRLNHYTGEGVLRTDQDGAVVFRTDGRGMTIDTVRGQYEGKGGQ